MTATSPVLDPEALARGLQALELDLAAVRSLTISDAPTALAIGTVLVERLRQFDALKKERDRVVDPIYRAYKNASETYAPHLKAAEGICKALKGALGAWETAQLKAKEQAMREAQRLVLAPAISNPWVGPPVAEALTQALTVANATDVRADGLGLRVKWVVKRYVPDLMVLGTEAVPGLVPDSKSIEAYARSWKGRTDDDPPVIPGVVFEREASVSR